MSTKALIVVDMQNDFVDPKGTIYCGPQSRKAITFVVGRVEYYLKKEETIIFLQDTHQFGDKALHLFGNHCIEGTWGHKIIPELESFVTEYNVYVIQKCKFSGFYNTGLYGIFLDLGVEDTEIVGVFTSMCVFETAIDAADRDYNVSILRKGVADTNDDDHLFFLNRLKTVYNVNVF